MFLYDYWCLIDNKSLQTHSVFHLDLRYNTCPGKLIQRIIMFVGMARILPRVEHLKDVFNGIGTYLFCKHQSRLEKIAMDKTHQLILKIHKLPMKRFGERPQVYIFHSHFKKLIFQKKQSGFKMFLVLCQCEPLAHSLMSKLPLFNVQISELTS